MRKLSAALVAICLVFALGSGVAAAKAGGTDRPYKCHGSGTVVFDPTAGTVTSTDVQYCTHTGRTTATSTIPFGPASSSFLRNNVAANGDVLSALATVTSTFVSETSYTFVNYSVFIGGTGRFDDATGSATAYGESHADPSNPLVYHSTYTVEGTISY